MATNPLSVLIYPDVGPGLKPTLMNAALYFERVYILGFAGSQKGVETWTAIFGDDLVRRNWNSTFTVSWERWLGYVKDSADLYRLIKPLVDDGVIQYAYEASSEREYSHDKKVIGEWLDEAELAGSSWPAQLPASLDLCTVAPGDLHVAAHELMSFAPWLFGPTGRRGTIEDVRLAHQIGVDTEIGRQIAHLISLLEFLYYRNVLECNLLSDSREHEVLLTEVLEGIPSISKSLGLPFQQAEAKLAHEVIATQIPQLGELTAEHVLEIRSRLRDELGAFRTEVGRLASEIETNPWQPDFAHEIERTVRSKVNPAVADLRRALAGTHWRFLKHLAGDLDSLLRTAVPFVGSIFAGFAFEQAAAVGLAAGIGGAALKTKLEAVETKRQNALTFVLEARQVASKATPQRRRTSKRHAGA